MVIFLVASACAEPENNNDHREPRYYFRVNISIAAPFFATKLFIIDNNNENEMTRLH